MSMLEPIKIEKSIHLVHYQHIHPRSVSSPHPTKTYDNLKETAFYDRDVDIHDPILSTHSMYEEIRIVLESVSTSGDILNLFHSNLVKATVPQTYNFPEMVQWCAEHYFPGKRIMIASKNKKLICSISP